MNAADWVDAHVPSIEQRLYQLEAWDALWQQRASGRTRALLHLATGLGKTSVAAVDVLHYKNEEQPGARVLFVSHMNDISKQARQTFQRVSPDFKTGVYTSGRAVTHEVTFATFQSLVRNLDSFSPQHFQYIIYDEAHHIEATTFKQVREHFQPQFELGLSATPERADGRDITDYFGKSIYSKSLSDGLAEGWLSPVDYHIVFDKGLKKAISENFDVGSVKELRALFQVKVRDEAIAKEVAKRRRAFGLDDVKTIVFCHSIENAEHIAKLLGGKAYHADMTADTRQQTLEDFREGSLQTICTVDMFNEGIDIPDARLVVFLRSTSSRTIFEQQLGRGLRRSPGKTHVTVLDFVANIERINFVAQLGRHLRRRESSHQREGTTGHTRGEPELLQFSFGTSFEFDDLAVKLLDKYQQVSLSPMPAGRVTIPEVAAVTGETTALIRAIIKRRTVEDHYDMFQSRGSGAKVYGLTQEQAERLKAYLIEREARKPVDLQLVKELLDKGKSVPAIARKFNVSNVSLYKRLKKAGIVRKDLRRSDVTSEIVEEAYKVHGSIKKTAKALGTSTDVVSDRLKKIGYTFSKAVARYTNQEVEEAYLRNNRRLRATAEELNINHGSIGVRLKKMGYDLISRRELCIPRDELKAAYSACDGQADEMCTKLGCSRAALYRELRKYRYFKYDSITPKQLEAIEAYERHAGSGPKAAQALGISAVLLYRRLKEAGYTKRQYGKGKKMPVQLIKEATS